MASRLFTKAPKDLNLESIQHVIAVATNKLNEERDVSGHVLFARVHVGTVLIDPRNRTESFVISFSDQDQQVAEAIDKLIERLNNWGKGDLQWFVGRGDIYYLT